jgi:hypothetical protein
VKDKLGSDEVSSAETEIESGLSWLSSHEDATADEYKEKQKEVEEKIRPLMMKLYSGTDDGSGEATGPAGPKVEEVD